MTNDPVPGRYHILALERCADGRRARALIAGPGAGRGVWYTVASARSADALVLDLNLTAFYAEQLRAVVGRPQAPRRGTARRRAAAAD